MFLTGLLRRKGIIWLMAGMAFFCGIAPQSGLTMPVDSQLIIRDAASQSLYLEKVQKFLNQEQVQKKLSALGFDKETAQQYIDKLDESQLQQLAGKIDTVETAGDTGIVIVLLLLLIVVSVLYFADYGVNVEPRHKK